MTGVSVEAQLSGFGAGRDQYIGIPPEHLPALIAAFTEPLARQNREQGDEIAQLSRRLGTSEGIVVAVLASLAPHLGELAPEALPGRVAELVQERQALLERQHAATDDNDQTLAELDRDLAGAIAAGDDRRTQDLLEQKRDLKRAAAAKRGEMAARLRDAEARDLLDAADSEAMLGRLDLARLDYRAAAARFRSAAALVPTGGEHHDTRLGYLDLAADALHRQGEEFGDNGALADAITALRALLHERSRQHAPLAWAATQNNLGNVLRALGEREAGTARLEEAVAAYRAALEERTRERVPLAWAYSQHGLAHALEALADRTGDPAGFAEASACMRGAAEVYREGGVGYWLPVAEESVARIEGKLAQARAAADAAAGPP